ncbi:unnamed protein product [Pleuronectes platessa]|uniref:Uncharacterized protein n=1 Tax=Pleuronectes platessa TaxID=8262 RepID=A0A9N7VVQ4_PLEPL|nr:unnamed protein product [Pleuronectes platessa]
MESVFFRFHSYDFESDQKFQEGLKVLHESNSKREKSQLQDMKLFFYNRFVEPIDRASYKQWSSASPPPVTQTEQETPSVSDSDLSNNQVVQTSAGSEVSQLSFAEVMRLIQEGKEVPGAKQLDIKPCNQSATPSQMERRLKPWETSASSSK